MNNYIEYEKETGRPARDAFGLETVDFYKWLKDRNEIKEDEGTIMNLKPKKIIKQLLKYIDIKKLLKHGEILIEYTPGGYLVYNAETKEIDSFNVDDDRDTSLINAIKMLRVLSYYILPTSKHENYRISIEKEINNDEDFEKINKIIGEQGREELDKLGFEIVKIVEYS